MGAARLQKRPEDHEQNDIGGQYVGHDPEHAITLVEDTGAQVGESITGMGDQLRGIGPVDAVEEHDGTDNNKDAADDPARELDPEQHTHRGDGLVEYRLCAGPVIDDLEICDPVADADNGGED